jgi:hypothetical protein
MAELAQTSLINDANLVAYYKLEDVNDSKGSRNLTNINTVAFNPAKFTNGADFGSANTNKDLEKTTDNYGLAGNQDVSFTMWYKCTGAPSSGSAYTLFIHRSQLTADRYLWLKYFNNSGTLQLFIDNSNTTTSYNVDLGTSIFHHLVLVRIGTTATKLYLDGVDTSTTAAQGANAAGAANLYIGQSGAPGNYVSGIIDDFAIFSRQLTVLEVSTLYNPLSVTLKPDYAFFL